MEELDKYKKNVMSYETTTFEFNINIVKLGLLFNTMIYLFFCLFYNHT